MAPAWRVCHFRTIHAATMTGSAKPHFPPLALSKLVELRIDMDEQFAATTNKSVRAKNKRIGVKEKALWCDLAIDLKSYFPQGGTIKVSESQVAWKF